MRNDSVRIVLNVEKEKLQAFVDMLKLLDFVTIESDEEFLQRFIEHARDGEVISDDSVADIMSELRYRKES